MKNLWEDWNMNNGDRIRQMNNKELAKEIMRWHEVLFGTEFRFAEDIEKYLNKKYDVPQSTLPEIADFLVGNSSQTNCITPDDVLRYLEVVENIVRGEFGDYIWKKIGLRNVFFVAAVQEDTGNYSYEDEKFAPQREFKSIGIKSLESWFLYKIEKTSSVNYSKGGCLPFVIIIIVFFLLVVFSF